MSERWLQDWLLIWCVALFIYGIAAGTFGGWISRQKGRDPAEGAWLSILLGPLGWILAALLPGRTK